MLAIKSFFRLGVHNEAKGLVPGKKRYHPVIKCFDLITMIADQWKQMHHQPQKVRYKTLEMQTRQVGHSCVNTDDRHGTFVCIMKCFIGLASSISPRFRARLIPAKPPSMMTTFLNSISRAVDSRSTIIIVPWVWLVSGRFYLSVFWRATSMLLIRFSSR